MKTNAVRRGLAVLVATGLGLAGCGGGGDGDTEVAVTAAPADSPLVSSAGAAASTTKLSEPTTTTLAAKMPKVIGKSEAQAKAELAKLGLDDVRVELQENLAAAGTVLEQVPSAGASMNGAVNLIVAKRLSPMPDDVGKLEGDVRSWYSERGVTVRTEVELHDDVPAGTIISTTPKANEPINGEVLFLVSKVPVTRQLATTESVEEKCDLDGPYAGDLAISGATQQNSVYAKSDYGRKEQSCYWDYNLGRDWETFKATAGMSDNSNSSQTVRFEVFVDGVPLYNQTAGLGQPLDVNVDVKNALRLRLRVTLITQGKAEAVFGNARLIGSGDGGTDDSSTTSTTR